MRNLGNSFIILVIAIVILWLAVTDKLSNALDAWKVGTGKAKAVPLGGTTQTASSNPIGAALTSAVANGPAEASFGGAGGGSLLVLPTLPSLGTLHS